MCDYLKNQSAFYSCNVLVCGCRAGLFQQREIYPSSIYFLFVCLFVRLRSRSRILSTRARTHSHQDEARMIHLILRHHSYIQYATPIEKEEEEEGIGNREQGITMINQQSNVLSLSGQNSLMNHVKPHEERVYSINNDSLV